MKEHHIQTSIRAPFYELKSPDDDKLIYVLHGYGQLAQFFIQKFTPLQKLGYTIVAPEGLHRFYLEGTSGRVGASWMTKVNRELDILNYIQFLDSLHETYKQKDWKSITVLGFSQGVATAFRWIANGKIEPQEFLLCSNILHRYE